MYAIRSYYGDRITKAADDAAGLAIGTRLEAQTRGLKQATRNANDGISLVQTAEGGLNETSNILIRLRELSVQAASDTVGDNERELLNKEYQQLVQETDRIANATVFNGTNLLNGESEGGAMEFQVGAFAGEQNQITFDPSATRITSYNVCYTKLLRAAARVQYRHPRPRRRRIGRRGSAVRRTRFPRERRRHTG